MLQRCALITVARHVLLLGLIWMVGPFMANGAGVVDASLPPGYDEELWCPPSYCLRAKEQPSGWAGPRSSFNECVAAGGDTQHPVAWGEKLGFDSRNRLVESRYTQTVCEDGETPPAPPSGSPPSRRRWHARTAGTATLPRPSDGVVFSGQHRPLGRSFTINLAGNAPSSNLVRGAAERFLERLGRIVVRTAEASGGAAVEIDRATLTLQRTLVGNVEADPDAVTTMEIRCTEPDPDVLSLDQPEGYALTVQSREDIARASTNKHVDVYLSGESPMGLMQGLEGMAQLIFTASDNSNGPRFPVVAGSDSPRFPWRGVLVDVARHFLPLKTLCTIIDGAAALRMNVLHLHLTDDQGWRFESTHYPEFHRAGTYVSEISDETEAQQHREREYYTPRELQGLVAYARERGLRIVPEVGFPAHATALLLARPDLGPPDTPAPRALADTWGVHMTCLDVSNEDVYQVVATLFEELALIFPDEYV